MSARGASVPFFAHENTARVCSTASASDSMPARNAPTEFEYAATSRRTPPRFSRTMLTFVSRMEPPGWVMAGMKDARAGCCVRQTKRRARSAREAGLRREDLHGVTSTRRGESADCLLTKHSKTKVLSAQTRRECGGDTGVGDKWKRNRG